MLGMTAPVNARTACLVLWGHEARPNPALTACLTETTVEVARGEAAQATLSFSTSRNPRGHWSIQDAPDIEPWTPVRIEAKFGVRSEEIMRGYVREVRSEYPTDRGAAKVEVICQDASIALDRLHRRHVWGADASTTDQAIIGTIAQRHGLLADCRSARSGVVHNQDSTDIRFLSRLARERGLEVRVQSGTLYFGPMDLDAPPQTTIKVYAGPETNCRSISIRDDGHRPSRVAIDIARPGEAPRTEVVSSQLTRLGLDSTDAPRPGLEDFVWALRGEGSADVEQLRGIARQKADAASMKVTADGELDGLLYGHVLEASAPVALDGVGERHDGIWFVDSVTHQFDDSGYSQRFSLMRNARRARLGDFPMGLPDMGAVV